MRVACRIIAQGLWPDGRTLPPLSSDQYDLLMEVASEQTVQGLLSDALLRGGVSLDKTSAAAVFVRLEMVKNNNRDANRKVVEICRLLRSENIRFCVVKGQSIAVLYPNPDVRITGDIDLYCYPEDLERCLRVVENKYGVKPERDESEQHYAFTSGEIDYELHFTLFKFASRDNQTYFDRLIEEERLSYVEIEDEKVPTLGPTLNLVYTFLHLFHHLVELGVGLRQFYDVAILCQRASEAAAEGRTEGALDVAKLTEILTRLDFMKAFKAIGAILVDNLGMPASYFPLSLDDADRHAADFIITIVARRGNFGKYGRKEAVRSGLRYYVEQMGIKLSHFAHLYHLAPKENRAVIVSDLPHRIVDAVRRMYRK